MKILSKAKAFFPVLLLFVSCSKENPSKPASLQTENIAQAVTPQFHIGESYGGGIIFYLDSAKEHGLIAAPENLSARIPWSNDSSYTTTGAVKTGIGTGRANTDKIISVLGTHGHYAALLCANYNESGYTDWYLPSQDELYMLSLHKNRVGNVTGGNYWSSSEKDSANAYFVHFHNDYRYYSLKTEIYHVRPIRSF